MILWYVAESAEAAALLGGSWQGEFVFDCVAHRGLTSCQTAQIHYATKHNVEALWLMLSHLRTTPPATVVTQTSQHCAWSVPHCITSSPGSHSQGSATFCTWNKIVQPQIRILGTVLHWLLARYPARAAAQLEDSSRLPARLLWGSSPRSGCGNVIFVCSESA